MNRLVIIGNGFDLAHGLPTSYRDFIDDYWKNFKTNCQSDEYTKLVTTNDSYNNFYLHYNAIKNFDDFKSNLIKYCKDNSYKYISDELVAITSQKTDRKTIFEFKSNFFKIINMKNSQNWVDIENEYYRELKKIVKNNSLTNDKKRSNIVVLNNEFEQVKKLLETYLNKITVTEELVPAIKNIFKINRAGLDEYYLEFPREDLEELKNFCKEDSDDKRKELITYCLNFNYTTTIDKYINFTKQLGEYRTFGQYINLQIHGKLNASNNLINFGFGDEMDDDYKAIENLDDNEYLKNFKSFQYLQNANYKTLLDFIDSEKFQVFIMGHSCGLSDRTLLNTVFEHNNCRSIKVFYHQRKDGSDNYTEIIQNISRHFNKKKLMREKIVNKTLCQPLPQIQLPIKG